MLNKFKFPVSSAIFRVTFYLIIQNLQRAHKQFLFQINFAHIDLILTKMKFI